MKTVFSVLVILAVVFGAILIMENWRKKKLITRKSKALRALQDLLGEPKMPMPSEFSWNEICSLREKEEFEKGNIKEAKVWASMKDSK